MRHLHRQAILFFLGPLLAILLVGLPYVLTGSFAHAMLHGAHWLDYLIWVFLLVSVLLPPVWGYRLTVNLARDLSQTTAVVRRVAEGDFSRTLTAWAAETSEMSDLEQGINATAIHLQQRLIELAQEKGKLDSILRNMADGVLLLDGRKKITLINPAAEAMFGLARGEVIGRDHLEVIHHFALDEAVIKVMVAGTPASLEIKRARPEEGVLECRLAPSGDSDRGVLMVLRDITRSRKLEQMRTDFVSNVTHELRTPLTSIRGFAETLLEGALDDPDTARQFVGIIKRESEHLGRLIEDILDLSRIESGKWKMKREPVALRLLAEETIGRLTSKATTLGVTLKLQIPEELPAVPGDSGRLAQVLLNLVDNALKYTPTGGLVTIGAADAGTMLKLSVADTGSGIPKAELPRIFERFYRVDKARSRATGGTGLGLSIVKHIVDAHGGTITVVSDTGMGATFTFTLPKA